MAWLPLDFGDGTINAELSSVLTPDYARDFIGITGEWIGMRIEVKGTTAGLFLNDGPNPEFIVSDLKLGADQRGGIGLWIEAGTVWYFANFQVLPSH